MPNSMKEPPFFPFGRQVAFGFKDGSRILFQCDTPEDSKELSDSLNRTWQEWKAKGISK